VALACTPPQRACPRCNGSGSFCTSSRFCPECAPQDLAPKAEEPIAAAPTCPPGQHLFTNCKGERVCAPRPFECAPPLAPEPGVGGAETVALACTPPERSCIACDGSSHYCARRCFECAPQLAPKADEPGPVLADLVPVTESCGGTLCAPGTHCCNPTCGICTPKGVNCTQQTCN
jgi:hypothetical protein